MSIGEQKMLLESFIAMYGISFFATKAIYTKLDKSKEIHEEALNQGLYHITSGKIVIRY